MLLRSVRQAASSCLSLSLWLNTGEIVLLTGRSSELGFILQTSHVARGSVGGQCFGKILDRLELRACDLELVCILFLVPWEFQFQLSTAPAALAPFENETSGPGRSGGLQAAVRRAKGSKRIRLRPGGQSYVLQPEPIQVSA